MEDLNALRLSTQNRLEQRGRPGDVVLLASDSWVPEKGLARSGLPDAMDAGDLPKECSQGTALRRRLHLLLLFCCKCETTVVAQVAQGAPLRSAAPNQPPTLSYM